MASGPAARTISLLADNWPKPLGNSKSEIRNPNRRLGFGWVARPEALRRACIVGTDPPLRRLRACHPAMFLVGWPDLVRISSFGFRISYLRVFLEVHHHLV